MNGDGRRAQMKVEMTLDAPPEAGAVADGGIIPTCVREHCKLLKVLCVQLHPVSVVA